MTVAMTLLSVLAATLLLSVLVIGLLLIVKSLQSVRGFLEQIAMGVRAIERQVGAFPPAVGGLADQLEPLGPDLRRAAAALDAAAGELERRAERGRRG